MSALWSIFPHYTHWKLWVQYGMKDYYEYMQVLMGFLKFIQAFLCGQHSLHSVWLSFTSCNTSLTTPYLVNWKSEQKKNHIHIWWLKKPDIDFIIRIAWHCRWLVRMLLSIWSNKPEEAPLSRTTKKPSHSCILKSKDIVVFFLHFYFFMTLRINR